MRENWKYERLLEVCDVYQPKTISKKELVANGIYNVYGANGIIGKYNIYNHEESEVLMGCRGACGCINISTPKSWINGNAMVVHPKNSDLIKAYLVYLLKSLDYSQVISGTAQPQITRTSLSSVTIPVPPLSEQERIVSYLDAEFAKIDTLKANAASQLQAAKDLFQSALKEMLTPKEGWEEKKLCDLYDVRDGTHDSPKYVEVGYPLVTSKNLRNGGIDMTTVKYIKKSDYNKINERSKVDVGDVLFAMIGTIGNPSLVEDEPNYAIKNMALFKVPACQNSKFLKYILSSNEIINRMKGQASGSNQPFVSLGYLRNFIIPTPSLPEQERIAARLDAISEKVKALQANYDQTINLCNDLKQSLLKSIFE